MIRQRNIPRIRKSMMTNQSVGEEKTTNGFEVPTNGYINNKSSSSSSSPPGSPMEDQALPLEVESKFVPAPPSSYINNDDDSNNNNNSNNNQKIDMPPINNQNRLQRLNSLRRRLKSQENTLNPTTASTASISSSRNISSISSNIQSINNSLPKPEAKETDVTSSNSSSSRNNQILLHQKSKLQIMDHPRNQHKNDNESQLIGTSSQHLLSSNYDEKRNDDIIHEYSDKLTNMRKSPKLPIQQKKKQQQQQQQHHNHQRSFKSPTLLRNIADNIPEAHFIGEIQKGLNIQSMSSSSSSSSSSISCKWKIEWGKSFSLLEGDCDGQTQYAFQSNDNNDRNNGSCRWNHPLDVHFTTASLKGWPRIVVELWELDGYGRSSLIGFGFSHFPCTSGIHQINIPCWRPRSQNLVDELRTIFLGSSIQLNDESMIFDDAWQSRHRLHTISIGQVAINVTTLLRFFDD